MSSRCCYPHLLRRTPACYHRPEYCVDGAWIAKLRGDPGSYLHHTLLLSFLNFSTREGCMGKT